MSYQKSKGIVLSQVKYSESSLIVKIYTEKFGLATYLFKGVRKKNPAVPPALLQHLSIVEIIARHQENKTIHFVKNIRVLYPYTSLPFDINKSCIALFLNELLLKSLKEEESNPDLFGFLLTSLQILDLSKENVNNFHLWFALQLSRFLGFMPGQDEGANKPFFDLKEGIFLLSAPDHPHYLTSPHHNYFLQLSRPAFRNYAEVELSNTERRYLIQKIIEYFQLHLQGFGHMKSIDILEEVLS